MARTIAINGTKLEEVRMLMEPYGNGSVSYLSYLNNQFHLSGDEHTLRLAIPAYLAVELYRTGVLPKDANVPVEISLGGRSAGWFTVSDVRYPHHSDGPFPQINFTLSRVPRPNIRSAADAPLLQSAEPATGTYVTDITHYLDEAGELLPLPGPARKLASFLTLVIEAATGVTSAAEHDSGIRCRTRSCRGMIRTVLPSGGDEISWHCPACGHNGVIRNWQNTKWTQRKRTGTPE